MVKFDYSLFGVVQKSTSEHMVNNNNTENLTANLSEVHSEQNVNDSLVAVEPQKTKLRLGERIFNKMPRPIQQIYQFISCEWLYFAVTLLIFSLFFGILFSFDIFPFGTDGMSNYDLLAQIVPFYEHFYDVIDGKSSLFYSPAIAGGADVFGTLAYCSVSPFTPLFLLFGRTQVYNAISFILPLKLSAIACSAIYFMKKSFPKINEFQMLIVSILYAFCGYMFVANTYINWLDFLIYMPFVVMGFKKLVQEKRIRYFAISYALMIYACFSIACFALFLVFIILIAYVFIACEKSERWELLAKICLSLVLAVALALPILIPSLFAYMRSGRNTGLFENMQNDLSPNHIYAKASYIVSDSLFLFLSFLYFVRTGFKSKFNRFLLVTAVILLMPVFIDEVCNLMNAGSYMSYALRFGFLNAMFTFYVAARLLNTLDEKPVNSIVNAVSTAVIILFSVFAVMFILNINKNILEGDYSSDSPYHDFSGLFAHSLGGIEILYQITLILFGLFAFGSLLYAFKLIKLKYLTFVFIGVLAVQISFLNIQVVRGNNFNPLRYDQYNAIFNTIDQYDDRLYYKVKDNNAAITNDMPLNTHTNSYGVFSSVIDRDNFVATNFFKYGGNQTNSVDTAKGTFFGDSLLGFKYFYVHTDDTTKDYSLQYRGYAVKLEETAQANFAGYENIGVFPNCYTIDSGVLKMDSGSSATDIQELYNFLGGKGDAFATVDMIKYGTSSSRNFVKQSINSVSGEVVYEFELDTVFTGQYYFEILLPEQYTDVSYNTFTASNVFEQNYYDLKDKTVFLNYSRSGNGVYHLNLKFPAGNYPNIETIISSVKGKIMPNEKVLELSEYLDTRACSYTQKGDTFTINATAENDDTYVLLNYVSIDGFKATVNGHKAEVIDNGIKFLLVKLDKGENTVVLKYNSPYTKFILLGICLGSALIVGLWLILKKFPKVYKKLQPVICVMALLLGLGILAFFYIYPSSLFAQKLVKLLIAKKP